MFDNVEDAFKQLESVPYLKVSKRFALYRDALMNCGFTRRESMRIVEDFAKLSHELALESVLDTSEQDLFSSDDDPEDS